MGNYQIKYKHDHSQDSIRADAFKVEGGLVVFYNIEFDWNEDGTQQTNVSKPVHAVGADNILLLRRAPY